MTKTGTSERVRSPHTTTMDRDQDRRLRDIEDRLMRVFRIVQSIAEHLSELDEERKEKAEDAWNEDPEKL